MMKYVKLGGVSDFFVIKGDHWIEIFIWDECWGLDQGYYSALHFASHLDRQKKKSTDFYKFAFISNVRKKINKFSR